MNTFKHVTEYLLLFTNLTRAVRTEIYKYFDEGDCIRMNKIILIAKKA